MYLNILFIVFSLLPFKNTSNPKYQKFLFYIYFIPNTVGLILSFIDFIYYRFKNARSNIDMTVTVRNETNKIQLLSGFLANYWYVFLLFFAVVALWIFLYKKVKVKHPTSVVTYKFYLFSTLFLGLVLFAVTFGIRGDLDITMRPINIVDANENVTKIVYSDVILNTPFCVFRNFSNSSFVKHQFVSKKEIDSLIQPIKEFKVTTSENKKTNVVIFIMESFGREYLGAFNKHKKIKNYVSYTPFLDSLSNSSLIFNNAYSNGLGSIHATPSIIAGIPSFQEAFTSSRYVNTKIESLVSVLNTEGYETSFFHGAPNGSMGFLGFSKVLGYKKYFGMNEYNNDKDFDGVWGIWDEKFFNYMEQELSKQKEPFMATNFSVSSHDPFQVPDEYKNKFKGGDVAVHKCIKYSDYSLRKFFEKASKTKWFKNTLFVITGDHTNQIYYDEYTKTLNRTAIPILFYMPANENLKGINNDWAQHIDIYPTVLDILGYNKPFRSWGRSLLRKEVKPFVINYINNQYQFMQGDYILLFDGKKATGLYHKTDTNFSENLKNSKKKEFEEMGLSSRAFIQNYYEKIIDGNLVN
ncbi:LTA synthase family protein [Flavobacterium sp.]